MAIETKFAPPYGIIYMDQVEQKFLATQINQLLIWLRYIDDMIFIWTHGEEELEKFMSSFNSFTPNLKLTCDSSKKDISFLDHKTSMGKDKLSTDMHIKPTDCHKYLHDSSGHPKHMKRSIVCSQLLSYYILSRFVPVKMILIGINQTWRYGFKKENTLQRKHYWEWNEKGQVSLL